MPNPSSSSSLIRPFGSAKREIGHLWVSIQKKLFDMTIFEVQVASYITFFFSPPPIKLIIFHNTLASLITFCKYRYGNLKYLQDKNVLVSNLLPDDRLLKRRSRSNSAGRFLSLLLSRLALAKARGELP